MKQHLLQIIVGLLITCLLLLHITRVITIPSIERLELWAYDMRLSLTLQGGRDDRIIIVDVDEKSLAEEGRWPWSRDRVAALVEALLERYRANIVGFDFVFAEADRSSGLDVLERFGKRELKGNEAYARALSRIRTGLDYDAIFARSIKGKPVVLGYYFSGNGVTGGARTSGSLPPPVFTRKQFAGWGNDFIRMTGFGGNIPVLQQSAMTAGHFNPATDADGVARRVPLLVEYRGGLYEALSLAVLRGLLGNPELLPGVPEGGSSDRKRLEWLTVTDMRIPVDDQAAALIPYRGPQGSFPYVSASDVLKGTVRPELLEGAIVLIGTTAPGLMDLRATPVSPVYAGVEIHANMIAGMLDRTIRHAPYYAQGAEFLTLLVAGLLLSLLTPLVSPLRSVALSGIILTAVLVGNMAAWNHGLVLPLATLLILIPTIYAFNMTYGFLAEARTKRHLAGLFGQYVPAAIVTRMSRDPERFTMEAESRQMTVLFSDVVGFTGISECMEPRQLALMMNEYLTAMTRIIYDHGGTIDKYIGDAIMAFWGAPLEDPNHARHAVEAARAMQREMAAIRSRFPQRGWPELKIGIGINTGEMRVGNMGSRYRLAYTVMGDAVNLASRLEGLTRQYGTDVIVGDETRRAAPGLAMRELDLVAVKGKNVPVPIHEPLDPEREAGLPVPSLEPFGTALAAYRSREWDRAEAGFREALSLIPGDPVCELYLRRIARYRNDAPPAKWNGVYTFDVK